MANYDVINTVTGETKEISVSVHEIEQWYLDNPEWKRDWSHGCASAQDMGEWKDTLLKKNPGWKTVLDKVKRTPKAQSRNLY